jgi:hypothetical protein
MNLPVGIVTRDAPASTLLVCESGKRWSDTARRFVGPFQHRLTSPLTGSLTGSLAGYSGGGKATGGHAAGQAPSPPAVHVEQVEFDKVRSMLASLRRCAVLWEVDPRGVHETALTIARIGVGRPDVLQLVAWKASQFDPPPSPALETELLELGVRAAIKSPEHFARFTPLIQRFFQTRR